MTNRQSFEFVEKEKLNKMYTDTLCKWKKDMGIQAGAFEI